MLCRPDTVATSLTVAGRVRGTLSVAFDDERTSSFTEYAADAMVHPQRDQCHDYAIKSAASGALRRCAMNLGSVFGLGLYFDGWTGDVIRRTIDCDPEDGDGQAVELPSAS